MQMIPRNRIRENPWNPNAFDPENYAKLVESIREKGFLEPLKVMIDPASAMARGGDGNLDDVEYLLIDGYHRWMAAGDLGIDGVPCDVWDITIEEAKIRGLQLNYLRGQPVPQRLAGLVHELNAAYSMEDLAGMLPWSVSELEDSMELLRLPADLERQMRAAAAAQEAVAPVPVTVVLLGAEHETFQRAMAAAKAALGRSARRGQCLAEICGRYLEAAGLSDFEGPPAQAEAEEDAAHAPG